MNRNELLSAIQHKITESIEPMITEYVHNHPEYFHNCVHSNDFICNFEITLSYLSEHLDKVAAIKPAIFVRLAGADYGEECNRFPHHPEQLCHTVWIDKKVIVKHEEDYNV